MILRRLDGSRVGWAIAATVVLLPAVLALDYILRFGVDVPYWDDWELVPLFADDARPSFGELFALYMEHRLFFPRIVMLLCARASGYDTRVDMVVSWSLLCVTLAILLVAHVRAHGRTPTSLLLFSPVAWLICTLRQHANLLWAWQVQITLAVAAYVAAAYCLDTLDRGRRRLAAALALAVVSGFSFSAGMAIWPAGLLQLVYQRVALKRPRKLAIASWLLASVAAFVTYLWDYHHPTWPARPPKLGYVLSHPLKGLQFTLAVVGNALSERTAWALPLGFFLVVAIAAAVVVIVRGDLQRPRVSFAIPIFAFGLLSAAMVVMGRAGYIDVKRPGFGIEWAVHSRYVTLVVFIVIGLYQLALAANAPRTRAVCAGVLATVIAVSAAGALAADYRTGSETRAERTQMAAALRSYRQRSDEELLPLYRDPLLLRGRAAILERDRLSAFRAR